MLVLSIFFVVVDVEEGNCLPAVSDIGCVGAVVGNYAVGLQEVHHLHLVKFVESDIVLERIHWYQSKLQFFEIVEAKKDTRFSIYAPIPITPSSHFKLENVYRTCL